MAPTRELSPSSHFLFPLSMRKSFSWSLWGGSGKYCPVSGSRFHFGAERCQLNASVDKPLKSHEPSDFPWCAFNFYWVQIDKDRSRRDHSYLNWAVKRIFLIEGNLSFLTEWLLEVIHLLAEVEESWSPTYWHLPPARDREKGPKSQKAPLECGDRSRPSPGSWWC